MIVVTPNFYSDVKGTEFNMTDDIVAAYAVNAVLGTDYMITKSLHVYLPSGYDASKQYNILYLMHGGGDNHRCYTNILFTGGRR